LPLAGSKQDLCEETGPEGDRKTGEHTCHAFLAGSGIHPRSHPPITPEVRKMLAILKGEMFRKEIRQILGLKDEKYFRTAYQQPAVAAGLIEMTVPDKPHSRLQKYRITPKGIALLKEKSL
jgi:ATP-dependent DNA helicase RecG